MTDSLNALMAKVAASKPPLSDGTKTLLDYMEARQTILLRRKAGEPGPWTSDTILQNWRFCNVYREDDRVTIWIEKNIRQTFAGYKYLWLMLAIARTINWPDTLQECLDTPGAWPTDDDWNPAALTAVLTSRAERGEKVYTGAYMIRAESNPNAAWFFWSKHRYIAEIVIGRLWEDREDWCAFFEHPEITLESTWKRFQDKRYIGWGPFMAYEVVTDLRHTRYLRAAPDTHTWANAGPGALRGLNRLAGRPLKAAIRPDEANAEMRLLLKELNQHADFVLFGFEGFEMRDVEHNLCEVDKYLRLLNGEGSPRSRYSYRTAESLD